MLGPNQIFDSAIGIRNGLFSVVPTVSHCSRFNPGDDE